MSHYVNNNWITPQGKLSSYFLFNYSILRFYAIKYLHLSSQFYTHAS